MSWAEWYFDAQHFDCALCRTVQQDQEKALCEGIERLGHCPEEKIPSLSPTNQAFWRVFEAALPGLMKPDGYDYNAIAIVFDAFAVPVHRRPFYMTRSVAVIDVIRRTREKRYGKHP